MIIVDCDVASTLAKIDRIDLFKKTFPGIGIYITNSVHIELTRSKDEGLSFPDRIFDCIPVIIMEKNDFLVFQDFSHERSIHFGEAEGLSIAKNRGAIFLSNDAKAIRFGKASGISVLGLKDLLVLIARKKIVTMTEMQKILTNIDLKDRITIKNKDRLAILDQFK
jgi:predicted nucleic acid-binding protein